MGVSLTKGGNVSLSKQAPGLTAVTVGLGWQTNTGYELDASALLCGQSGKVLSDEHFVFFNNLTSPDGSVRHAGGGSPVGGDDQQIHVDLTRVPDRVEKIVFPVSLYEGASRGQGFGQVLRAHIRVLDQEGGTELARYDLATGGLANETALVFGELYRHGAEWKFRAVGQGYAAGLAGIATDYGVDVPRETAPSSPPADPSPISPPPVSTSGYVPPAPMAPAPAPTVVSPPAPAFAGSPQPTGSSSVTCFFDPSHGPGMTTVTWTPQWGVPRPVQACGSCAQRVQTTVPPFYTPPQQGYPQPVPQGYSQPVSQGYPQPAPQGYTQQGGYGQPYGDHHHDHHEQGGGRRFGAGALIGAGAAGLVGGALLNEAFDDDEPDVVVNNYYED
ncbi:TerD family protein [Streptomyces carpinensis]|uniref:TerD family protein n=1 Tax=Streptomyces carpinensis TaxID=66369 RepID=A0ABV1W418_9ACTN|nr:TerD family protein [Streptomyces carpinensis]